MFVIPFYDFKLRWLGRCESSQKKNSYLIWCIVHKLSFQEPGILANLVRIKCDKIIQKGVYGEKTYFEKIAF